jgi:hypothetical protein
LIDEQNDIAPESPEHRDREHAREDDVHHDVAEQDAKGAIPSDCEAEFGFRTLQNAQIECEGGWNPM